MSRPLPFCALCGKPLAGARSRVLITAMLPGSPTFGWHVAELPGDPGCSTADVLALGHFRGPRRNARKTLAAILRRGDVMRIAAGVRFWAERENYV